MVNENEQDDKLKNIYRSFLRDEVERPEVKRDKEYFIENRFKMGHPAASGWGHLVPALASLGFAAVVFVLFWAVMEHPGKWLNVSPDLTEPVPAEVISLDEAPSMGVPVTQRPGVEILRLGTEVGSAMVYQKRDQDLPMTIIWVFPRPTSGAVI